MNGNYDVIIIGGGVMGCATAYYLLKLDQSLRVAIIERDPSYERASTTLSDGNIRIQFNVAENIRISQFGLAELAAFSETMAVGGQRPDVGFRRQGNLFLFDEVGKEAARNGFEQQRDLGCEVEWLNTQAIGKRYPLLETKDLAGGTFGRDEGTMDPHTVLQGLKNKATDLGAKYLRDEVSSIRMENQRANGVDLTSGKALSAAVVVNSAGPWINQLTRSLGFELPISPVKRQVFVLETDTAPEPLLPLIVFPSGLYLIQEHGRQFMCGKSLDDDPITDSDFSWSRHHFEENLWPELVECVPSFDRLKIVSGWAGLYAVNTFDGNAILGMWPGIDGLFLMGGFSGHGFQQCFGAGRYIAELILNREPSLDLSIFAPQRIIANKPVYENPSRLV
jgi:glycine/D-amino acid oxidase-like deaminating enzyme